MEGIIRVPYLTWSRLENDLKEYLAQRHVDGKNVFAWYHRQFFEAAQKRYLGDAEQVKLYHSALADIFIQDKGIKKTIHLSQRKKTIKDADRCVTPQQMCTRNARKLNCMPYHLYRAERFNDLKKLCMLNFKWLYTKLKVCNCLD